jgi:hypothetical protein
MSTRPKTKTIRAANLTGGETLVGNSEGLSIVYQVDPSNLMMGCVAIETEHGTLYMDEDEMVEVLA